MKVVRVIDSLVVGSMLSSGCRVNFDLIDDSGGDGQSIGDALGAIDSGVCVASAAVDWANWRMPNDPGSGLPNIASYSANPDGLTVTDNITGLTWQRAVAPAVVNWAQAKAYCANLVLAGCEHWRLPERIELVSIVDYSKLNPSIDVAMFPNTPIGTAWSATVDSANSDFRWQVDFFRGYYAPISTTSVGRVRCVR